ncbi:MAG: hypothetical protein ACI3VB_06670 [Oscillospiraceae bacterium]
MTAKRQKRGIIIKKFDLLKLREHPVLKEQAANWFCSKWNITLKAYQESMDECILRKSGVPQWYLVLSKGGDIIAGAGVIENDGPETYPGRKAAYNI